MKSNTKKLDWVDGIKAFAIVAILLNHFVESFGEGPWFSSPSRNWPDFSVRMSTLFPTGANIGVQIIKFLGWLGDMGPGVFILLSGLTLTISALNKPLKPIGFYTKRLLRIYPLYITIHIIVLIVAKYWFKWDIHFFSGATLLSLAGLRFTDSLFYFLNPSWWFIWVIIQMYILFPFLLIFLKKNGVKQFLILTFLVTVSSRLIGIMGLFYHGNLFNWMTGIFGGTRLFEFTFGMYLGYLLFNNNLSFSKLLDSKLKLFLISLGIYVAGFICSWTYTGSLFSMMLISTGLSGLFYSLYKFCFRKNNAIQNSWIWIGRNSFSVFLLHQPFMEYVSPLLKGTTKAVALIAIILLSFIAGYIIEKVVGSIIKFVESNKQRISNFFNSRLYHIFILLMLTLAMAISFGVMLGFSKYNNLLKLLLFVLVACIALYRIIKKFDTSLFISRFFDAVLFISAVLFLITENWLSTYWCLILIASVFLFITYKFKYIVSVGITLILLVGGIYVTENYLRKNAPVEVLKWGEFPALQIDPETIFSLKPNKTTHLKYNNYDYYVKTNSMGFSSEEINLSEKADNEKRILIIGDAFSMPEGLDYESSYPYLLEQQLRRKYPNFKINVINGGVTGYGPNEEYAQLKKYINIIKPDIVINQFFVNEYDDINILKEQRRKGIGFFVDKSIRSRYFGNDQTPLQLDDFAQKEFGVTNKLESYFKTLLDFYKKNASFYDDTVVTKVSKYFDKMKNLCSGYNAKYIVMYVPGQIEVSKPKDIYYYPYFEDLKDTSVFNFSRPQTITENLCLEKNINYLNTTLYLKDYPIQPVYFKESWHWNNVGHKSIADYLSNYIITNNLL
ncbi:MAG TPA: acyltransferase family protein [Ginsengibacter sp.]